MIAAEKWYEYQRQYQKYGLALQPEEEEIARRAERKKEREAARTRHTSLPIKIHTVLQSSYCICVLRAMWCAVLSGVG